MLFRSEADPTEPTGLLSHHLVHDEACWDFLDRLLGQLVNDPRCRFPTVRSLFDPEHHEAAAHG